MAAIDVGNAAVNQSSSGVSFTNIAQENAANGTGTIDHIDLYCGNNDTYDFASFDDEGSAIYSTIGVAQGLSATAGDNDFDAPGDFTAFNINTGNLFGEYHTGASGTDYDSTTGEDHYGGAGVDLIPCSSQQFSTGFTALFSIGATGTTGAVSYTLVCDAGSYAITGTAMAPLHDKIVGAVAGSYAITGTAMTPLHDKKFVADAGSYAITGTAVSPLHDKKIGAAVGSYAITGTAMSPLHDKKLICASGSYVIGGQAVSLIYSGGVVIVHGSGWHMFQDMSQT